MPHDSSAHKYRVGKICLAQLTLYRQYVQYDMGLRIRKKYIGVSEVLRLSALENVQMIETSYITITGG